MKKIAKFTVEWAIKCALLEFYPFLLDLENHEVLTSTFIASLSSLSSLSKIHLYLLHSSAMLLFYFFFFSTQNTKMANPLKDGIALIKNSKWMPHNSHDVKIIHPSYWLIPLL